MNTPVQNGASLLSAVSSVCIAHHDGAFKNTSDYLKKNNEKTIIGDCPLATGFLGGDGTFQESFFIDFPPIPSLTNQNPEDRALRGKPCLIVPKLSDFKGLLRGNS